MNNLIKMIKIDNNKGDVSILEINKIYNEDCLIGMDEMIKQGIKVDAIISDIPYGTTKCKWDSIIPFDEMWKRLKLLRNENTPIILFGSEPFSSALRMSNIKEYKYDWKWNKTVAGNPLIAKHRPLSIFEDIMVFGKGKTNYYPIMIEAEEKNKRPRYNFSTKKTDLLATIKSGKFETKDSHNEDLRYPKNEIVISSRELECNPLNRLHPTQKPVKLMEYLINTYTKKDELILDFTCGVASTAIACINTKRNYIGFELDNTYYNLANERINKHIESINNNKL